MAIAYEGAVGGTDLLTAFPGGLVAGDYMQATLSVESVAVTPTAATGWILISTDLDIGAAGVMRVWTYYIIRGASDPANNWTLSGGMVSYIAFSGVESIASPFNQTFQQASANASSLNVSGRTTTVADVMKVSAGAQYSWGAWASSTMTNEALDAGGSGPAAFYYETAGAAGPTGTESFTGGGVMAVTDTFLLPFGLSVPNAPTITFKAGGHTRAGLEWTAGASVGAATTDWDIDAAPESAPTSWLGVQATSSTLLYGAYTGLTNGTPYVFRVREVNANGDGAWSATSTAATPSDVRGFFLLENGDKFLLEDGTDRFLLESGAGAAAAAGPSGRRRPPQLLYR